VKERGRGGRGRKGRGRKGRGRRGKGRGIRQEEDIVKGVQ
jgi:hypothetical protein